MMWITVLCLLVMCALLVLYAVSLEARLAEVQEARAHEASLRAVAEIELSVALEELLGDRLRKNRRTASEVERAIRKASGDGRTN